MSLRKRRSAKAPVQLADGTPKSVSLRQIAALRLLALESAAFLIGVDVGRELAQLSIRPRGRVRKARPQDE